MGGREVREARIWGLRVERRRFEPAQFPCDDWRLEQQKPRVPPVLPAAPCESRRSLAASQLHGSSPKRAARGYRETSRYSTTSPSTEPGDVVEKGLPRRSPNRRNFRGVSRQSRTDARRVAVLGHARSGLSSRGPLRFHREDGRTGGPRGENLGFASRAAALRACAGSVRRLAAQTTKKLADLPSSLLLPVNLGGPGPRVVSTEAARGVPLGATEGRHVSFCKQAAVGQPTFPMAG
jgi:hypothetical protein